MNVKTTYFSIFAFGIMVSILLLNFKKCENKNSNSELNLKLKNDSILILKQRIKEIELFTSELYEQFDSISSVEQNVKVIYVDKKNKLPQLEDRITNKDSATINYVIAANQAIAACDSLISTKESAAKKLQEIIVAKDSIIALNLTAIEIQDSQIEVLEIETKKQRNKIKILKIQKVVYPIAAVIATAFLLKN